jgi:hypothetical protein
MYSAVQVQGNPEISHSMWRASTGFWPLLPSFTVGALALLWLGSKVVMQFTTIWCLLGDLAFPLFDGTIHDYSDRT